MATTEIDPGGIRMKYGWAEIYWQWEAMDRTVLTDGGVILVTLSALRKSNFYIPSYAFVDRAEMEAFHAECQRHIQEAIEREEQQAV